MKYIINENKLTKVIENYLDNTFDLEDLNWSSIHDDDGNPTDDAYEFYNGDYFDGDTVFRLYNKSYWSDENDFRVKSSPILMFERDSDYQNLNNMFGDKWKPIFINWFKKNFGFDIKTFDSY